MTFLFPFILPIVVLAGVVCGGGGAPAGPWDAFNIAPSSRVVYPVSVKKTSGTVEHLVRLDSSDVTLQPDSWLTLDFGKEVSEQVCVSIHGMNGGVRSEDG